MKEKQTEIVFKKIEEELEMIKDGRTELKECTGKKLMIL